MRRRHGAALFWPLLAVAVWAVLLATGASSAQASATHALLTAATSVAAVAVWARVRRKTDQRAAWSCFAVGLSGYACGYVVLFYAPGLQGWGPGPLNLSDCLSLLLCPGVLAGSTLVLRNQHRGRPLGAVLDGATIALAVAALLLQGASYAYPELVAAPALRVFLTIVYPVAVSALAVSMLAGVISSHGRAGARWWFLIGGFSVMSLGEFVFMAQLAEGTFAFGTPLDAAFAAGPLGAALAAWTKTPSDDAVPSPLVTMILPVLSTVGALVVLADPGDAVPTAATVLAVGAVLVAVARTMTFVGQERALAERTLEAGTDPLTGLLNRRALLALLADRLGGPEPTSLALVDLDRFKEANDSLGHVVGDELLLQLSGRLSAYAPKDAVVARLGGDAFAVVLTGTVAQSTDLGTQLVEALARTVTVGQHRVSVGASVGLAQSPAEGDALDPLELVRRADVALYRSKQQRVQVETWRPELDVGARERLTLVADLRAALDDDGQLVVHLQPKNDTRTRQVVGFEALVRWNHPSRGMVPPDDFIAATERAGLLPRLTEKVLDLALLEAAALLRGGRSVPIAVNVGAPDLLDVRFASRVAAALEKHALPASVLRLEITETVVMTDPARVLTTLGLLRRLGIKLSLDDYGTGLSSLSYLRTLPVDELKVDRSFVARVTTDDASRLIVRSTITLAHGLGLTVVAEGVEDLETLQALADADCDVVQGYLLGRPVAACDLVWPDAALTPEVVPTLIA